MIDATDKPKGGSTRAHALNKKRDNGDSRLLGLEFAGRRDLETGGSKLYVRAAPA